MSDSAPVSPLDAHLGYWLRLVSNQVSYAFQAKVEACGVTVAEWVVLRELFDADGARPSDLAARLGMTRGAVSKLVDRLETKSLLTRTSDDRDARIQLLTLSKAGRKLVPRLAALADANDAEWFGDLGEKERAALAKMLRKLAAKQAIRVVPVD